MTTRRDFFRFNLAVGAASLIPLKLHASALEAEPSKGTPFAFLHEVSVEVPHSLYRQIDWSHTKQLVVDGGLESLWLDSLYPVLARDSQTGLMGVTTGHQAFVIQEMSRDLGYSLLHSELLSQKENFDLLAESQPPVSLDPISLNTFEPVFWTLGPSGVNYLGT